MLPKKVQVGPMTFKIIYGSDELLKHTKNTGENVYGLTDYEKQVIYVDNNQAKDYLADTTLHEFLHAIFHACGLNSIVSDLEEEKIISILSPALLDAITRNPAFFKYLAERG